MSARHDVRVERWRSLSGEGAALGVAGVIGKAVTPAALILAALILAAIGLLGAPPLVYAGGAAAVVGLAVWWATARAIGARVGLSTGRVMWKIWLVPTWSFVSDLADVF